MQKTYAAMQHAGQRALRLAPVFKHHLPPPNAVAVTLTDGRILAEASLLTSTTISASAGGRLRQRVQDATPPQGILPRIAAIYGLGRGAAPALSHADLHALWPLCQDDTLVITDGSQPLPLRDLWRYAPPVYARTHQPLYKLTLQGDGRARKGHAVSAGFSLTSHGWPALQPPDPTDLTPLRAVLADIKSLYSQLPRFSLHCLRLSGVEPHSPLSGRDWQALAREAGSALPVHWQNTERTLADFVPSIYSSTYSRSDAQPERSVFQEHNLSSLSSALQHPSSTLQALQRRTLEALAQAHAPFSGTPRAASILFADGAIVSGSNVQLSPVGVPSCAESLTLWQARHTHPHSAIRAIMIMVAEDNGTILFGSKAAPCGFCREHLCRHMDADTAVIISNGHDRFCLAPVGGLLQHNRSNPAAASPLRLTVMGASGRTYSQVGFGHAYDDCTYPPTAVQTAYQHQDAITAIGLDNVTNGIGAYLRSVILSELGAQGVVTIEGETVRVAELCPEYRFRA